METQSREVCCCGARSWTLAIGWIIMAICGIEMIALLIVIVKEGEEFRPDQALRIFSMVFQMLLAIGLITGVYKRQHKMLQAWCVLTGIGLVLGVFQIFKAIIAEDTTSAMIMSVLYPIFIFFIWVVNVHRKEILANGNTGTTVTFESKTVQHLA